MKTVLITALYAYWPASRKTFVALLNDWGCVYFSNTRWIADRLVDKYGLRCQAQCTNIIIMVTTWRKRLNERYVPLYGAIKFKLTAKLIACTWLCFLKCLTHFRPRFECQRYITAVLVVKLKSAPLFHFVLSLISTFKYQKNITN